MCGACLRGERGLDPKYAISKIEEEYLKERLAIFHNTLGFYFLKSKEGDMIPRDMDILMTHFEAMFHKHLPVPQLNRTSHIHESFPLSLSEDHSDHSRSAPDGHPLAASANK